MQKTIGILGGGQLGRMSAAAAARLGIKCVIYSPGNDIPASQTANATINADYSDESALRAFADQVDVITYEFENVPLSTVNILQETKSVYPRKDILEISQNRIKEKTWLSENGFETVRWKVVKTPFEIFQAMKIFKIDKCVIKTAQMGYDGKGQAIIESENDVEAAWSKMDHSHDIILEEFIEFDHELSVIVARDMNKNTGSYDPSLNEHKNHILDKSKAPAPLPKPILGQAKILAEQLADKLMLVGVMGIELFLTKTGKLLVNEIAPRPHNSGHWTMDACFCSQFEQHIRAVSGLPLGSFKRHHNAEMINLIGHDVDEIPNYLLEENTVVHLYGKEEIKEGRKMGHINRLLPLKD